MAVIAAVVHTINNLIFFIGAKVARNPHRQITRITDSYTHFTEKLLILPTGLLNSEIDNCQNKW